MTNQYWSCWQFTEKPTGKVTVGFCQRNANLQAKVSRKLTIKKDGNGSKHSVNFFCLKCPVDRNSIKTFKSEK